MYHGPLSQPIRVREKHFSLFWLLVKGTRFWERYCYSLFAILFFAIRQELSLHYSKSLGFATNPKSFSTGFVLVLTNKYESGLKKVPRLCHESGTLWIRNPKRKLCIQKFSFVQTCSCFTKPYSPLSPPDPSSLCLHKIALAMISFPGRLI